MEIEGVISLIAGTPSCTILPPAGNPVISTHHTLPEDVREFYALCGGVRLFEESPFRTLVSTPAELQLANPIIVGGIFEEDISSSWYIVASDGSDSRKMTIDLSPERLGRCYDSFWDRHAVAGSSLIIALSFTEFLHRSVTYNGSGYYWWDKTFTPYGDAYD
jgi:hypothetical protein